MEEICEYCHKPLQRVECAKYEKCIDCNVSIHEFIGYIYWVLAHFFDSFKQRYQNHKYKVTCVNKDCINYLKGCYVNKHGFEFGFEFNPFKKK